MLKYLFALTFIAIFNDLASQIVVNEIVFQNESTLKIEIVNKSAEIINITSVNVRSDTFQITREFKNYAVQPSGLSLIEFELSNPVPQFEKVSINISTEYDQYSTSFKGCILMGESAGRYPDAEGDFVIYKNSQISPGNLNSLPGILIKKTSKTKFSPRDSSPNAALYFNSCYWIFGGWDYNQESDTYSSKANIWKSGDGVDWSLINDNPPFSPYSTFVVFNNKMMVLNRDTVFISEDGLSWDKHRVNPAYADTRYIVFKDKLCWFGWNLMGESTDGINWTITPSNFPWDEIPDAPALVSSGDRLWMYGGIGHNDVWTSLDGLDWEKVLDKAPWSPRIWFNYTYFDNKLWMIAGNDQSQSDSINYGNLQDFWYSPDGVKWDLLKTDSAFNNRHGSFLWNDRKRVLISSGFGNNLLSRMYNDVWELDPAISLCSPESTDGQTLCVNTPLKDIKYAIKSGTGAAVSGLPEGVNGLYAADMFTISGTPTLSGAFNYSITTIGPNDLPPVTGTITVGPDVNIALTSAAESNLQTLFVNTPQADITYKITCGTQATVSGLPEGVNGSYAEDIFTISGTPTVSGIFNYTVTTMGHCNLTAAAGTITVNPVTNIITAVETTKINNALIFPNPSNGTLKISIKNQFSIRIINMAGNQIFHGTYQNGNNIFEKDFSSVFKTNGLFLIVIKDSATGHSYSQKIVVML